MKFFDLPPLHQRQAEVFACPARFRVLVAGRRFGKTHLALYEMLRAAQKPGSLVWYVAPNDKQSKEIVWERLKKITEPFWAKRPLEDSLRIDLIWGSTIVVKGAFHPDSLRGVSLDFLVIDEFASMHPRAWLEALRAALSDRKGRALFIGTPKGCNHFYDLYQHALRHPADWAAFQFTSAQGEVLDAEELAAIARDLDHELHRQEMEAQFVHLGLYQVYQAFSKADNVKPVSYYSDQPLIWSLDFNVNPMCMLLMQKIDDETVHVIEEFVIKPHANTEMAAAQFVERAQFYYDRCRHRPLIIKVYGDASGGSRRTAGTQTDWAIVKQAFNHWRGALEPQYFYGSANPPVRDRVNCVNARLRNQAGDCRILIDPSCRELIRDLEEVSWAADSTGALTEEIDKSDRNRTHCSDALGYYICRAFPMVPSIGPKGDGRIF